MIDEKTMKKIREATDKKTVLKLLEKETEEFTKPKPDQPEKPKENKTLNPIYHATKFMKKRKYKKWEKKYLWKMYQINMELSNGIHETFPILSDDGNFNHGNKKYIIDEKLKYYNNSSKLWCLDYHEEYSLPVERKIPTQIIKKEMKDAKINDLEYITNPKILRHKDESNLISQIFAGVDDAQIKKILILVIIVGMISVISLIVILYTSGVFQK